MRALVCAHAYLQPRLSLRLQVAPSEAVHVALVSRWPDLPRGPGFPGLPCVAACHYPELTGASSLHWLG